MTTLQRCDPAAENLVVTEMLVVVRHDPRWFPVEAVRDRVHAALPAAHLKFLLGWLPDEPPTTLPPVEGDDSP